MVKLGLAQTQSKTEGASLAPFEATSAAAFATR